MSATNRLVGWSGLLVLALLGFDAGCHAARAGRVEVRPAPPIGDVAAIVKQELTRATSDRRRLLVYVGASWCEPCQRFHHAAAAGELDARFPSLRLIEFDSDRDAERLVTAGYVSRFIPLFALPLPDGRSSGKQVEGSVKGDAAILDLAPRLEQLLAAP